MKEIINTFYIRGMCSVINRKCYRLLPELVRVSAEQFFGENVLQTETREKGLVKVLRCCGRAEVPSATVPVHDVGGEGGGETEHVEADLCGSAEGEAGHDREQGQVDPQPCRSTRKGKPQ